ncbi:hypothetical protein ACHAQH_009061 [Verticillium albo-atrum]
MPSPGPGEIVIRSRAVAINPLDWHMQDWGVFVKEWPSIFGCDVAGEAHEVGPDVTRFKPGDRVTPHTINLVTGKPRDAAFAHYCVAPATKAAHIPASVSFESGAVLSIALEAAVCGLTLHTPGIAMPGVSTPVLSLPSPKFDFSPIGNSILVHGGLSSVGLMTIQLAVAIGLEVMTTCSPRNFDLCKSVGATAGFDYKDPELISKVAAAFADKGEFVGILDAIFIDETYAYNKETLARLGGGHLACTHPPPAEVAENIKAGMTFAVNDVAQSVWDG